MELEKPVNNMTFELLPSDGVGKGIRIPNYKKRVIVGRSHTADIVLPYPDVSAIHCVIEVYHNGFKIYDMNSSNGTFYNGKKIIMQEVQMGEDITIASHSFVIKQYVRNEVVPPVLNVLDIDKQETKKTASLELPNSPTKEKEVPPAVETPDELPHIIEYPLAKDSKAEYSEYIFEDVETLYPIFNYHPESRSVEVIIEHNDNIYSVDYLPLRKGTYYLSSFAEKAGDIEYAYLSRGERIPFITISDKNEVTVSPLAGYRFTSVSDQKKVLNQNISLNPEDILEFDKGNLKIYVRGTEAPPSVKPAPLFTKDNQLRKLVLLFICFALLFSVGINFITVDKELEKDKAPKRIATILYKKPLIPTKTNIVTPRNEVKQKPKTKSEQPKQQVQAQAEKQKPQKAKDLPKAGVKNAPKGEAKKAEPKRGKTNNKTIVTKNNKAGPKAAVAKSNSSSKAKANKRAAGRVEAYKAVDFSATMSSLMAKGSSISKVENTGAASGSNIGFQGLAGGDESAQIDTAKISHSTGSIAGTASGTLDASQGTEGLASKHGTYTIGFPDKVDLIGSMDPDVIMAILREHIPEFRSCYQRVLSMSTSAFSGAVDLNFTIAASGHVSRAGNKMADGNVPTEVRKCLVNVLRGIKFPSPMGGAQVEVSVPMNLYPNAK